MSDSAIGKDPASGEPEDAKIVDHLEQTPGALQAMSDADQSLADDDQTASDEDQTASDTDAVDAADDQRASDRDQITADNEHADKEHAHKEPGSDADYERSRDERQASSFDRAENQLRRSATDRDRDDTATRRDRTAAVRDDQSAARDREASTTADRGTARERDLRRQLDELRAAAALERAAAAADRARAADFRVRAAQERAGLEADLRSAHIDHLTGAFRREMGNLALEHGIDRARRSDGRFVIAYVDVDRLKEINDVEGHAAGDHILQAVARSIRSKLRSFDPVIRYGGDEFVCGLGGTDLEEAEQRFERIEEIIRTETGAQISVGFAAVETGEAVAHLVARADQAMLLVKAKHRGAEDQYSA